jgi:hypothetical protein
MLKPLLHTVLFLLLTGAAVQAQRPVLAITQQEGALIRRDAPRLPLLKKSLDDVRQSVDRALGEKMDVPVPVDPAGAYTHERHKSNYTNMYQAGLLYVITRDTRYADYIRTMLLAYARLVPTLKNHPQSRGSSPGRLFHQALNDANWLVYSSQAYDCIYTLLTPEERKLIEDGAFRPLCQFLTGDLKNWFNLIHNHGVWATVAVGMTGFAIGDDNLVQQALYGTGRDGKGGFLALLRELISPDGYYTEGPYYTRYAVLPYFVFAQALEKKMPALKIFEQRDEVLRKMFYTAIQFTNTNGAFFPVNDALKEKSYVSGELVFSLNMVYHFYGRDPALLGIAGRQQKVLLNGYGHSVASGYEKIKNRLPAFPYRTYEVRDGADGTRGGMSLLRPDAGPDGQTVLFKYTAHGLSHGHYDRLNLVLYNQGNEILTDYGAARFINVEQKDGGRYLPENKSFAMQTIAHNTITVDEVSHFRAREADAEAHAPEKIYSITEGPVKAVCARESNATPGVMLERTVITVDRPGKSPLVLDVFRADSESPHQYDLPFWYNGQVIAAGFPYQLPAGGLSPLGKQFGYQHIWKEAEGKPQGQTASLTLLNGSSFYTLSTWCDSSATLAFLRSGAADPNFNLRREPAWLIRKQGRQQLFFSVIESHGYFSGISEASTGSRSAVKELKVLQSSATYTVVQVSFQQQPPMIVALAHSDTGRTATHRLDAEGRSLSWTGPLYVLQTAITNDKK